MAATVEFDIIADASQANAEVARTDKNLDNLGKTAQSGGAAAKAGLSNLEQAAKSSASAITQNKAAIAAYDKEIVHARGQLAQMSAQLVDVQQNFGRNSVKA